jgi:hypothetical protein
MEKKTPRNANAIVKGYLKFDNLLFPVLIIIEIVYGISMSFITILESLCEDVTAGILHS